MAHLPNGKPEPTLRKALVTGGTTGLGESIALQLQADGYQVAVCGRRAVRVNCVAPATNCCARARSWPQRCP